MAFQLTTIEAHPEHIATVAAWFEEEWPDHFATRDAREFVRDHARTDGLPLALLVLDGDEPIATVALRETSIDAYAHLTPWVGGLYVKPSHRGQGVGQLLIVSASRIAWSMGFERVYTGTQAGDLFAGVGWGVLGEVDQAGERLTVLVAKQPERPPTLFEGIGGEEQVRALVDRFYDLMDARADASEIRSMHARSLKSSRQKLFEFLTGWMGGPNLYIEKYGHPRLRARHLPFSIGTNARDQWLACMNQALDEVVEDEATRNQLKDSFAHIADHMRNREGS